MPRRNEVRSASERLRSKGQENWVGIPFLIFVAVNRSWLLDKESRPSASGGAGRCPSASSDFFARLVVGSRERCVPPTSSRAAVAERGLGGGLPALEGFPGDFSQRGGRGEKHRDLVNLTFFFFLFSLFFKVNKSLSACLNSPCN